MNKLAKEQELQQKYMHLQVLEQQIKQLQNQLQQTEQQTMELMITLQALDDIKQIEEGTEILVPLASGIFAKAEIMDNNELMLNVGAGTAVKKDIESTKKMLEKQMEEIRNVQVQFTDTLQGLEQKAQGIQQELTKLMS